MCKSKTESIDASLVSVRNKTNGMAPEEDNRRAACDECGKQCASIIGCPDGAEVCQQCFDSGLH